MEFGKKLRKLRESRQTMMQELARSAGTSIAALSQVEAGRLIPTDDTAKKFLDALEVDETARNQFYRALKKDRIEWEKLPKEKLLFGDVLRAILERLNTSGSELARRMGRPIATVGALVAGSLLPGDDLLVETLIPELRRLGATHTELRALKMAHLEDVLTRSLPLKYLTKDVREKIIIAALNKAKRGIS